MSTPEWKDLERLWQSDLPAAAPALDVIARQQKRRWAWHLTAASEVLITIVGAAVSVWVMTLDVRHAPLFGGASLGLTAFAAGASLWARAVRRPGEPERSLLASLDDALHRARVSVRWGLASFWVMVAFMLFIATLGFAWAWEGDHPPDDEQGLFVVIAMCAVWGAFWQAFAIVYYERRTRELARLEELRRALGED